MNDQMSEKQQTRSQVLAGGQVPMISSPARQIDSKKKKLSELIEENLKSLSDRRKELVDEEKPSDEELREQLRQKLYEQAKISPRYATKVVPNHGYDRVFDQGDGLYLHGQCGVGKTHMAWALILGYLESHMVAGSGGFIFFKRKACLVSVQDLLENIRATFDGAGSSSEVIEKYARYDLLVLDDLGKEIPTEWVRSKLFQIINRRYNDCKATIITSQYAPDKLVSRLSLRGGEDDALAIESRLIEMSGVKMLNGGDRRRRQMNG